MQKSFSNGLFWSAAEQLVHHSLSFILAIYFARSLGPNLIGLVAMASVVILIANILVAGGLSAALIGKSEPTDRDLSTVFIFSVGFSFCLYSLIFSLAPLLSNFYSEKQLTEIIRTISIVIAINSFQIVPKALLTINLNFYVQALTSSIAIILSGLLGVLLVNNGAGVWAIVFQQITYAVASTVLLSIFARWRPTTSFSRESFVELFGFGSRILSAQLLDALSNNVFFMAIGSRYSSGALGLYDQAMKLSAFPAMTLMTAIQRVSYPWLAKAKAQKELLNLRFENLLWVSCTLTFPVMFGIAALSDHIVLILLGPDWINSAVLILILSIGYSLHPLHALNLNMLQVAGRSDLYLWAEIVKKIILFSGLTLSFSSGIVWIAISVLATGVISFFVNVIFSKLVFDTSVMMQLRIGFAPIMASAIAWIVAVNLSVGSGSRELDVLAICVVAALTYSVLLSLMAGKKVMNAFRYVFEWKRAELK